MDKIQRVTRIEKPRLKLFKSSSSKAAKKSIIDKSFIEVLDEVKIK